MANEFKAAGIYAELGFKINKQELKQLTEFKKSIQEVKRALGSKTSTAGIARVTSELKKQKAVNKSMLSDLKVQNTIKKAELDLEKRLAKVSSSRRGTERSAFSRAKKGLLADPTSAGMAKFRDKTTAIKLRADEHALVIVKETTKANNKKAESINKISTATRRAKAAEAKKSFKSAVSGLTESSNPRLKSMASYYKQEEKAANAAARAVDREWKAQLRGAQAAKKRANVQRGLNQQMRDFRTTLLRSTQAYTAFATIVSTARVGSDFEGIRAQFKSVFGQDAASEMAFVTAEANRLGVGITETAKAYAKFNFSAKLMGNTAQESKKYFRQLQEAGAGLGLTSEEITGTTKAFSDMMAKGTVQAEELKGQLGDRLPGAVAIAAKAMDMSTSELMKAMEGGKLSTKEFMGPFLQALEDLGAPGLSAGLNTTGKAYQRLKNRIQGTQDTIMQSGLNKTLKGSMDSLGLMVENAAPVIALLVGIFTGFVNAITFAFKLVLAVFADLNNFLRSKFGYSMQSLTDFAASFGDVIGNILALFMPSSWIKAFSWLGGKFAWLSKLFDPIIKKIEWLFSKLPFLKGKTVDISAGAKQAGAAYAKFQERGTQAGALIGLSAHRPGADKVDVNVLVQSNDKHLKATVSKQTSTRRDRRQ